VRAKHVEVGFGSLAFGHSSARYAQREHTGWNVAGPFGDLKETLYS